MEDRTAHLTLPNGKSLDLPILSGSLGQDVIDISHLGEVGYFTYDPGFVATASCESKITYINGVYNTWLQWLAF